MQAEAMSACESSLLCAINCMKTFAEAVANEALFQAIGLPMFEFYNAVPGWRVCNVTIMLQRMAWSSALCAHDASRKPGSLFEKLPLATFVSSSVPCGCTARSFRTSQRNLPLATLRGATSMLGLFF